MGFRQRECERLATDAGLDWKDIRPTDDKLVIHYRGDCNFRSLDKLSKAFGSDLIALETEVDREDASACKSITITKPTYPELWVEGTAEDGTPVKFRCADEPNIVETLWSNNPLTPQNVFVRVEEHTTWNKNEEGALFVKFQWWLSEDTGQQEALVGAAKWSADPTLNLTFAFNPGAYIVAGGPILKWRVRIENHLGGKASYNFLPAAGTPPAVPFLAQPVLNGQSAPGAAAPVDDQGGVVPPLLAPPVHELKSGPVTALPAPIEPPADQLHLDELSLAYARGEEAALEGLPRSSCPFYVSGSHNVHTAAQWRAGWEHGATRLVEREDLGKLEPLTRALYNRYVKGAEAWEELPESIRAWHRRNVAAALAEAYVELDPGMLERATRVPAVLPAP